MYFVDFKLLVQFIYTNQASFIFVNLQFEKIISLTFYFSIF
jgi:hypothetical protein